MGPPSSGGSTDGEALNILEGFTLSPADRARAFHLFIEASRFSFADRNAYLADSDFFPVPLAGLLSDGFAAERRALINAERAAVSPVPPGNPYPYNTPGQAAATATTGGQMLIERLDLGATLPQAIARPRASQRNTAATVAEPAFVSSPEGQTLA